MDELEDRFRRVNGGVTTYSSVLLGSKNVHTMDPENVKTILRTNWKDYGHSPSRKASFGYLGNGILVTDGPEWEVSRSMLRPSFKMSQIRNLPALEEHVANLITQIKKEGEIVDLQPLFFSYTLDTIFETLMGEKLNSLLGSSNDKELAELPDAVDYVSERAALRQRLGPLTNLILGRKFWNDLALTNKFISDRVSRALASRPGEPSAKVDQDQDQHQDQDGGPNENQRYVFLHEIVKRHDDAQRIRGELLHVLGAGRNTTASVLSVLCYTIARQPDVLQKLQQEIQQQVGPDPPTYENLRRLNYLKWTINESQCVPPQE
jgi:cytochrome P450